VRNHFNWSEAHHCGQLLLARGSKGVLRRMLGMHRYQLQACESWSACHKELVGTQVTLNCCCSVLLQRPNSRAVARPLMPRWWNTG
jgi:hypothetical protein